ncbi:MAG: hypothetical protein ACFFEK_11915 [Candidatus Thorarchaeota archaeon]
MAFEIGIIPAGLIAFILPIIAVCVLILFIPLLENKKGSRIRRYLSYLITPPRFDSEDTTWRKDRVKLYFYYLGLVLFLVTFMISEFYEVMFDLLLPVSQGSTGEFRIVSSVMFQGLFNAGWIGSLPWLGLTTYHETWSWILFTAAFTDNPLFLSTIIEFLILISMGVGVVFLLPLAVKSIRHSFLPSMFFYLTGMMVFSKAAIGCLATGLALAFGRELEYGSIVATGPMVSGLWYVVVIGFFVVLGMFTMFALIGRRLWKVHYPNAVFRKWFIIYIALCFWGGLAVTMILV